MTFCCWANAGLAYVDLTDVVTCNAGNNDGWFTYEPGDGYMYQHNFRRGQNDKTRRQGSWGRIVELYIAQREDPGGGWCVIGELAGAVECRDWIARKSSS